MPLPQLISSEMEQTERLEITGCEGRVTHRQALFGGVLCKQEANTKEEHGSPLTTKKECQSLKKAGHASNDALAFTQTIQHPIPSGSQD